MMSYSFDDIITFLIVGGFFIVVPGVLTVLNIYNCFSRKADSEKIVACITVILGGIYYAALHSISFNMLGDWDKAIYAMQYHNSISSDQWWILWIVVFGFAGYFILLFVKPEKMPPLLSVLSICALILLNVFQIAYAIQLAKNVDDIEYMLFVYHFNILLLSARVIYVSMNEHVVVFRKRLIEVEGHNSLRKLYSLADRVSKYSVVVFMALFLVVTIIEILLIIAGQGLDAPIKAFTDTADWTFSQQTPPPPLEYDGHYLCTVAAGGHKKVVKPLRLGTRGNHTIVVNRQLCIANAFEEVIQEKLPKFHKNVRQAYDTYGYPLSKVITNPFRADFVYFIMKPLEWLFLVFLYLVDLRPEKRIARQYAYKGIK